MSKMPADESMLRDQNDIDFRMVLGTEMTLCIIIKA